MGNLIKLVVIGALLISIPLGIKLAQERQVFKPKAAEEKIGSIEDGKGGCCGPYEVGGVIINDGLGCNDTDLGCTTSNGACTSGYSCTTAVSGCTSYERCNDNNECTINSCNVGSGQCEFYNYPDGTLCNYDATQQRDTGVCRNGSCVVDSPPPPGGGCSGTPPIDAGKNWVAVDANSGYACDYGPGSGANTCNTDACVGKVWRCQNGEWVDEAYGECTWRCTACRSGTSTNTPTPTRPPGGGLLTPTPPRATITQPPTGACTVAWELPSNNPSPNTNFTVKVKGVSDPGNWQNIKLTLDGAEQKFGGTFEGGPTFVYDNINSGSAGSHTLRFAVDSGNKPCSPDRAFTTSSGGVTPGVTSGVTPGVTQGANKVTLSGKVVDTLGQGISGVKVNDYWVGCLDTTRMTQEEIGKWTPTTDAQGRFSIPNVDIGTQFCVRGPEFVPGHILAGTVEWQVAGICCKDAGAACNNEQQNLDLCVDDRYNLTYLPTATAFYRISDKPFGEQDQTLEWKKYASSDGREPVKFEFNLENPVKGQATTIFVQFKSNVQTSAGVVQVSKVYSKQIKYLGPDPVIENISCKFDPSGQGTLITILGSDFGPRGQGKVQAGEREAEILNWVAEVPETTTPPPSPAPTGSQTSFSGGILGVKLTKSKVVAKIPEQIEEAVVELQTDDGRAARGSCVIGLTTLDFAARSQCLAASKMGADKARVQLYEKAAKARPIFDQNVSFNTEGQPEWTAPILEVGKEYNLVLKAPKSLGVKKEFTALEGTTVFEEIELPVGDIAPLASPDNAINANDFSELKREWTTVLDVTRPGDFNLDNRVNSLDYSCLIKNYNRKGEDFLKL